MFFLISFVYFSYSLQCEIYVSWLNPVLFFSSLTFTTWSICPSSHAEIKRDKERRAPFSLSPSPRRSCLGRCVPPLFVYFGKEAPLSTCLLRVKEGLTAANCALQQDSVHAAGSVQAGLRTSAPPHLKQHCKVKTEGKSYHPATRT